MTLRVALATLCLNEEEFIVKNYEQHKDWPGMVQWVFVEAADPKYAEINPNLVTKDGLSVDGTGDLIRGINDDRVKLIEHGWMNESIAHLAKTVGRDRYLTEFEETVPNVFVVIDADEFYTEEDQTRINWLVSDTYKRYQCWRLTQRHIWRPPILGNKPLFELEVLGGYWDVRHTRVFKWQSGIRYRTDHNWPIGKQYKPLKNLYDSNDSDPQCIHLGFAKRSKSRNATNSYYQQRGEGVTDNRIKYVTCRGLWENWRPGKSLPYSIRISPYNGPIPECYG